jgi:hypothetical protein
MLYIISVEVLASSGFRRVNCSFGYESRDLEEVPYYYLANGLCLFLGVIGYGTFNCVRTNSATLVNNG